MRKIKYRDPYLPELCDNQFKYWSPEDRDYLINWYKRIPSREIALSLGRSHESILSYAAYLRRKGMMS